MAVTNRWCDKRQKEYGGNQEMVRPTKEKIVVVTNKWCDQIKKRGGNQ